MKSLLDYKNDNVWLMHGDCLDRMKEIPSSSVDMILTDPPYGTTACKWDSIIPLDLMWDELKRVIKPNGAIVMTASQPFTTKLISSNYKMFKYCCVWEKTRPTGFFLAKKQILKKHEDVVIFYGKQVTYNPEMVDADPDKIDKRKTFNPTVNPFLGGKVKQRVPDTGKRYPTSVLKFASVSKPAHPTQKPVPLMEYLIKTYTNEGETVLDFTYGSGTTGVACMNLNRNFIGIEMDDKYFNIGKERILMAQEHQRGITTSPSQVA